MSARASQIGALLETALKARSASDRAAREYERGEVTYQQAGACHMADDAARAALDAEIASACEDAERWDALAGCLYFNSCGPGSGYYVTSSFLMDPPGGGMPSIEEYVDAARLASPAPSTIPEHDHE